VLAVVWALESLAPEGQKDFMLKIKAADPAQLQAPIERLLGRNHIEHELRSSSNEDLTFSVKLPLTKKTDRLTQSILALRDGDEMAVEWADRKPKEG
jgi:hypothetical protein